MSGFDLRRFVALDGDFSSPCFQRGRQARRLAGKSSPSRPIVLIATGYIKTPLKEIAEAIGRALANSTGQK